MAHSSRVLRIACRHGWLPGARYTNLRDVRQYPRLGFLDINWRRYDFRRHLEAAMATQPAITVARDVESAGQLGRILDEAHRLREHAGVVIIVPKDPMLADVLEDVIPPEFVLGYSVPTRYGGTVIPPSKFRRPVHLLGGRPDVQRRLADMMPVISLDCNRFTLDARFGDYFDGFRFRPHPIGGYARCIEDSVQNINALWRSYRTREDTSAWRERLTAA